MPACDVFWFLVGHILLIPFALLALVAGWIATPFYFWSDRRHNRIRRYPQAVMDVQDNRAISPSFIQPEEDTRLPHISIVIPFHNREHEVQPCLNSIFGQVLPADLAVEIIAVDNNSADGTLDLLRQNPVHVIECEERGPGAARNAGVAAARGEIVAFIDSDCVADPDWLMRLTAPFEDPEMLMAGGLIQSQFDDDHIATFTARREILSNERFFQTSALFAPFFATANAACRRTALVTIKGFDNNLKVSEDADLAWRLMDLGGRMAYVPDAIVYHAHRTTWHEFYRQAWDYGAGSVALFAKHRKWLKANTAISWRNIRELAYTPVAFLVKTSEPRPEMILPDEEIELDHQWDNLDSRPEKYWFLWRTAFTTACLWTSFKLRVLFV